MSSLCQPSALSPLACTAAVDPAAFAELRIEMALDGFKWDIQVGDTTALADFALVLAQETWSELKMCAEALAAELISAERELQARPDLWPKLGLRHDVRLALGGDAHWTPAAARVVRFDFHPTPAGWRISEANTDVPGGYTEASRFTQRMAELCEIGIAAGDPTDALCTALIESVREHGRIGLLVATAFTEDHQVVAHLSSALRQRGIETAIARPDQIVWRKGVAHLAMADGQPVDALFRFFQGEWIARRRGEAWQCLFRGGQTPVCNPAGALLTESKRFPLVWDELATDLPTWRTTLPATHGIGAACRRPMRPWVLKQAYSNNGEATLSRSWSKPRDLALAFAHACIVPRQWIAQDPFSTTTVLTPRGPMQPCLGVYTVNGRAAGIYGRLTSRGAIDYTATDVAVLIES